MFEKAPISPTSPGIDNLYFTIKIKKIIQIKSFFLNIYIFFNKKVKLSQSF